MRKIYYFTFTFLLVISIFCLFNLSTEEPDYLRQLCPVLAVASWVAYFYIYKDFVFWEIRDDSSEYPPLWIFSDLSLIFYSIFNGFVALAFINRWIGFELHWYSWVIFFLISGAVSFMFSAFLEAKEDPDDNEGAVVKD